MTNSKQISDAAKPMFDRFSEALKVVGAGNGAGLFGMVAAMNTISADHPHAVLLLKPTALIFALGVALFGLAYLFLTSAYNRKTLALRAIGQWDARRVSSSVASGAPNWPRYFRRT